MTTYPISRGVTLRTSATKRWLVVSVYDGRAKVEHSTDDENRAAAKLAEYRTYFGPQGKLLLIDQGARRPLFEGIR